MDCSSIANALAPFCPISKWSSDEESDWWYWSWHGFRVHMYIIDDMTGDRYLNQEDWLVRVKCGLLLIIGTPLVHTIGIVINVVYRLIKVLIGYHFWKRDPNEGKYDLSKRAVECGKDCLRVLLSPIILPVLELAALEGIFLPNDGRKVFANTEAAFYNRPIFGCFHPNPTFHLFGGDINDPRAW